MYPWPVTPLSMLLQAQTDAGWGILVHVPKRFQHIPLNLLSASLTLKILNQA